MEDVEMELDLGDPMPQDEALNWDAPADGEAGTTAGAAETQPAETQPTKVHLRGLDELSTKDIRAYVAEHFADEEPQIEWIDDTSANLVFSTPELASTALTALTLSTAESQMPHSLQLRSARPPSTRPEAQLQARLAVETDRKRPRAADASRFYLLHPEHDPRERRGQRSGQRSGSRRRRGDSRDRRRRRDSYGSMDADDEARAQNLDASMYDDDEAALAARRRRTPRERRRSRSRSPSSSARTRDRRRDRDEYRPAQNAGKELFPGAKRGGDRNAGKELFAPAQNRAAAKDLKKELFPHKAGGDDAADLLGRSLAVPFVDGADAQDTSGDGFGLRSDALAAQGRGLSIKGAAGFSIKGAAAGDVERAAATEAKVKELFPGKAGNRGKELFAGRRDRRTAETFY